MAYIETIDEPEATGELAELYTRVGNPDGTVDNVMKIHALNPESLRAHFEMYVGAMHRPSPLSRAERELVAVAVSRLNGCAYCLSHHRAGLERLLPPERHEVGDRVAESGGDAAGSLLGDRESAMIAFAEKLTASPRDMECADVDALRAAGLDDRGILDLAQCVGYFNYVNRIVNSLGVELGAGEGETGQWPQ